MTREDSHGLSKRTVQILTLGVVFLAVFAPLASVAGPIGTAAAANDSPTPTPTDTETDNQVSADGQSTTQTPAQTNNPKSHEEIGSSIGATIGDNPDATLGGSGGSSGVQVTILPKEGESSNAANALNRYGSVNATAGDRITGTVPEAALTDLANSSSVRYIQRPAPATSFDTGGEDEINATELHNLNSDTDYKGDGATIAVIDLENFQKDNAVYGDQVISRRNTNDGSVESHGTKTAEIVAETAPEANLILSKVDSYTDLRNEIDYLRQNTETDVISISIGYVNAGPLDGTSAIDSDIAEFTNSGGIFVTAAGNQGNGNNWYGTYQDSDDDNIVDITDSRETIDAPKPSSGSYNVYLQWNDYDTGGSDEDYDLQVINGDTGTVIRESTNTQDGSTAPPEEAVQIKDTDTNPQLRIKHISGATDAKFSLRSFASVTFTPHSSDHSITIPSTGPDAVTVGAYGPAAAEDHPNSLEPFSSRGPTIDGRTKPDLVGPDGVTTSASSSLIYGTSFAAPHVAGLAGIAKAEDSSLAPSDFKTEAQSTATSIQSGEPNNQVGYGLANGTGILSRIEVDPPTVGSYSVSDAEDSNGVVATGDQLSFSADVADDFPDTVTVDGSNYDAGTVTLTDGDGDGVYDGTATVGSGAAEGASQTTLTASDIAGNTQTSTDSTVTVDNKVTSLSVDNGPLNPEKDAIQISGEAEAVDTIAFKISDPSDGESDTITKSISSTSFDVSVDATQLSFTAGNGELDTGSVIVDAEQAESFSSAEAGDTFEADKDKPTVSISGPSTGTTVTSDTAVDITYTVDDTNNHGVGSATVELVNSGGQTVDSKTVTSITDGQETTTTLAIPSNAKDGDYDIVITGVDSVGNSKTVTDSSRITVDDVVSSATVDSDTLIQPSETVTISGTATSTQSVKLQLVDSDGDSATVSKSISSSDFTVSVTPDALSYSGGDGTLDDGTVEINLEQDGEYSPADSTVSVDVDGTAPTISVASPSSQVTETSGDTQDVTLTVDDTENHGVNDAVIEIAPNAFSAKTTLDVSDEVQDTGSVTIPTTTLDGAYDIKIVADDAAGNTKTTTLTDRLKIDDTVTSISAGDTVVSDTITLSGEADSAEDLTFTITGSGGTTTTLTKSISSSSFSVDIPVSELDGSTADGDLTIDAGQGDSNADQTLSSVTLDTTKPDLSIDNIQIPQSPMTSGDTVDVSYTPDDTNNNGIESAQVSILDANGNTLTTKSVTAVTDGDQKTTSITLPDDTEDGTYDVQVSTTDVAGNTKTTAVADAFTVDNVVRSLDDDRSQHIYNDTASIPVSGTIDATTGIKYQVSQDGSTATVEKDVSQLSFGSTVDLSQLSLSLTDGSFTIKAKETQDLSGSTSTTATFDSEASTTATIDSTAPVVSISTVDTTAVKTGDDVTVTYTSDDTNDHGLRDGVVKLVRDSDGTVVASKSVSMSDNTEQSTTITVPDTSNGQYSIEVVSNDTAYNTGTASSEAITVDNKVGSVAVNSPSSGIVSNDGSLTLTGTADAATQATFQLTDGEDSATVTKTLSSSDYTTTIDLSALSPSGGDGEFDMGDVTINADQSGSYSASEASTTVTVDTAAPSSSVSSPTGTTVEPGDDVSVTYTTGDPGPAKLDSATVKIVAGDGSTLTSTGVSPIDNETTTTTSITVPSSASDGTYDVVIGATDSSGNSDSTSGTEADAVTVKAPEEDDGGGGGGGGGAIVIPEETETETETSTSENDSSQQGDENTLRDSDGAEVTITGNSSSVNATVAVSESANDSQSAFAAINSNVSSEDASVKVESVGIETNAESGDYTASVSVSSDPISDGPSENTLGTVDVGHSVSDDDISEARFVIGVDSARLEEQGMDADEVALYRLHDGDWTQLNTDHIRTDRETEMYQAESPGLSTFAIADRSGAGENITSTSINKTEAFQNDKIGINATVENPTTEEQTYTVAFNVSSDVTEQNVTVAAESNRTVTHVEQIPDNVGGVNKAVYVNGVYAGTIEVQPISSTLNEPTKKQLATDTPTATEEATDPETDTPVSTSAGGPGFTAVLTILALLGAVLLGLRQR